MLAWFLGIFALHLIWRWRQTRKLCGGVPVDVAELATLCRTMRVREPAVRINPTVRGPVLIGVIKPTIVLPPGLANSLDRPPIIAHELAHLKHHDLLWNWLPVLATALLPVHPIVWIAHRRWRLAVEASCDADAIRVAHADAAEYGRLIVSIATTSTAGGILSVAAAGDAKWLLQQRIRQMTRRTGWNNSRTWIVAASTVALGLVITVPFHPIARAAPTTNSARTEPAATAPSQTISNAATMPDLIEIDFWGNLVASTAEIRAPALATIKRVLMTEGQAVKKGDVLVEFEASQTPDSITKQDEEVDRLAQRFELVKTKVSAANPAIIEMKNELDAAKTVLSQAQERQYRKTQSFAPFDGKVSSCTAQAGTVVNAGRLLGTVVQTGELRMVFKLPFRYAGKLPVGSPASVRSGDSNLPIDATVSAVAPTLDPDNQTQQITVSLPPGRSDLMPGMLARVYVGLPQTPPTTSPEKSWRIP